MNIFKLVKVSKDHYDHTQQCEPWLCVDVFLFGKREFFILDDSESFYDLYKRSLNQTSEFNKDTKQMIIQYFKNNPMEYLYYISPRQSGRTLSIYKKFAMMYSCGLLEPGEVNKNMRTFPVYLKEKLIGEFGIPTNLFFRSEDFR